MLRTRDNASDPAALLLMGPTASGKSGIAQEIAEDYPVEIISVDSAQVYKHMDIGTAKPSAECMATTKHHLVNLIDPSERYSVSLFLNDAQAAMRDITTRGKIPLLVGGTMLYFRALLNGLSRLPPADTNLRKSIEGRATECGWEAMHRELSRLDPVSAARIHPADSQRIQRALEVCHLMNKPLSAILMEPTSFHLPFHLIKIALIPPERTLLHQRIAHRFRSMLGMGLVDEVRSIRDRFCVDNESPSMRSVGYRQVLTYLDGKISPEEMENMAIAATRQLAKRQLTWLRPMRDVKEFDCFSKNLSEQVRDHLAAQDLQ